MPDDERLREFRRLLQEHGAPALRALLTRILEATGFPDPKGGAQRIVSHLQNGTALSRTLQEGANRMVDMTARRSGARLAQRLAAMPDEQRGVVLNQLRHDLGPNRFADFSRALVAGVLAEAEYRAVHGSADMTRPAAGYPNDREYNAVLRASGATKPTTRSPHAARAGGGW